MSKPNDKMEKKFQINKIKVLIIRVFTGGQIQIQKLFKVQTHKKHS